MARLDWSRLHSKILRSSIWTEEPLVRLVWICALADSETDGSFYGSPEVLSRAWNLPIDTVESGLERLCQPDPKSSTKDHEGRRIVKEGENEWRVLNKRLYNPSGEPIGASTPRVQKHRALKTTNETDETPETGNDGNGGNALEEIRLEEKRLEKKEGDRRFARPSLAEIKNHADEKGWGNFDAEAFHAFYESKGWVVGRSPMRSWKAAMVSWRKHDGDFGRGEESRPKGNVLHNPERERMELDWNSNEKIMAEMEGRPPRPWPGR